MENEKNGGQKVAGKKAPLQVNMGGVSRSQKNAGGKKGYGG